MNAGKICISLCCKTASELFAQVERVKPYADIIELRLDFLDAGEVSKAVDLADENWEENSQILLATFRAHDQGGHRPITKEECADFWFTGNKRSFWGGDFEEDIIDEAPDSSWSNRIASFHDFSGRPSDLDTVFDRLSKTSATHLKIAIKSEKITDAIPVWKLLQRATTENKPFVPIAMGEAGKWTRILGLAHGSCMTYASPETGSEAAPGQISAPDLIDVFRVKELDRETEVFGIVAGNSSYSVSPWMHNAAFKAAGMNRVFIPLQVAELEEFIRRMVRKETREVELNFRGFSVTNPHKQEMLKYVDEIDETAAKIGAINTVKIEDNKLFGFNTDAPGFIMPLKKAFGDLKDARVSVVGAGGASRACVYSLLGEGAEVTILARDPDKASAMAEEFAIDVKTIPQSGERFDTDIVVNATPLGTKDASEPTTIATAEQLRGVKLVYDLVYNPLETRLIKEATMAGVAAIGGLEMLIAQGARQFEIWTRSAALSDEMAAAVKKKLNL